MERWRHGERGRDDGLKKVERQRDRHDGEVQKNGEVER